MATSPELRHQHEVEAEHQRLVDYLATLKTDSERQQFIKNQEKKVSGYPKGSPKKEATQRFLDAQKAKKTEPVKKTESDVGGIAEESDLLTDVLEDQLAAIEQTDSNAVGKFFIDLELSIAGLDASNSTKIKTEAFLKKHAADKKRALKQTGEFNLDASMARAEQISAVLTNLDAEYFSYKTVAERNKFLQTTATVMRLLEVDSADHEAYKDFLDTHKEESEAEPTEKDIEEQLSELEWRRNKDAAPDEALAFFEGAERLAKDRMASPAFVKAWERFSETHKDEIARLRKFAAPVELSEEERKAVAFMEEPGAELPAAERLAKAKEAQRKAIEKFYNEVRGVYEFAKAGGKEALKVFFSDLEASLEKSMKDNKRRAVENFLKDHKEEIKALNKPESETLQVEAEPMTREEGEEKVKEMVSQLNGRYKVVEAESRLAAGNNDDDLYRSKLLGFYKQIEAEAEAARSSDPKSLESEALFTFFVRSSDQINRLERAVSFADALKAPGGRERIIGELKREIEGQYQVAKEDINDAAAGIEYYNVRMLNFFESREAEYEGSQLGSINRDALGEFLNDHQKEIDDLKRAVKSSEKPAPKSEARKEVRESDREKFTKELNRQYDEAKKESEDIGDSKILLDFFLFVEGRKKGMSRFNIFGSENMAYDSFLLSHKQEILDLKEMHQETPKEVPLEELPQEAVLPELPPLPISQAVENETPQMIETEGEMNEARQVYLDAIKEYQSAKARKGGVVERVKKFFSFKKEIGAEQPPKIVEELKNKVEEARLEYISKRTLYAREVYIAKTNELKAEGLSGAELERALSQFRHEYILLGLFASEENLLHQTQASELMPEKKQGVARKAWNWYSKQPTAVKVLISTAVMTGAFAVAGEATVASVATFAGARFIRALAAGSAARGMTWAVGKIGESELAKLQQKGLKDASVIPDLAPIASYDTTGTKQTKLGNAYVEIAMLQEKYERMLQEKAKFEKKILAAKILSAIATGMGVTTTIGLLEQEYWPNQHEAPKKMPEKAPKIKPLTIEKPALAAVTAARVDMPSAPTATVEPVSVAPNIAEAPEAAPQPHYSGSVITARIQEQGGGLKGGDANVKMEQPVVVNKIVTAKLVEQQAPAVAEREIPTHEEPIVPKAVRPAHAKVEHQAPHAQEHLPPKAKVVVEKTVQDQPLRVAKVPEEKVSGKVRTAHVEKQAPMARPKIEKVAPVTQPAQAVESAHPKARVLPEERAQAPKQHEPQAPKTATKAPDIKKTSLGHGKPITEQEAGARALADMKRVSEDLAKSGRRFNLETAEKLGLEKPFDWPTKTPGSLRFGVPAEPKGITYPEREPHFAPESPKSVPPGLHITEQTAAARKATQEARQAIADLKRGGSSVVDKLQKTAASHTVDRPTVTTAAQPEPHPTLSAKELSDAEARKALADLRKGGATVVDQLQKTAAGRVVEVQADVTDTEALKFADKIPGGFKNMSGSLPKVGDIDHSALRVQDQTPTPKILEPEQPPIKARVAMPKPGPAEFLTPTAFQELSVSAAAKASKEAAAAIEAHHAPIVSTENAPVTHVPEPESQTTTTAAPEHLEPKVNPLAEPVPKVGERATVISREPVSVAPKGAAVKIDGDESLVRTSEIIPKSVKPYSDYLDHKNQAISDLVDKYANDPVRGAAAKALQDQIGKETMRFVSDAEANKLRAYTHVPKGDIAKTLEQMISKSSETAPTIKSLHNISVRFIQDHGSLKPVLDAPSTAGKIYNAMDWNKLHIFKSGFASEALERNHDYVGRHLGQIDLFRKALDGASGPQADALRKAIQAQMKEVMDTVAADEPKEVFNADLIKKFWK